MQQWKINSHTLPNGWRVGRFCHRDYGKRLLALSTIQIIADCYANAYVYNYVNKTEITQTTLTVDTESANNDDLFVRRTHFQKRARRINVLNSRRFTVSDFFVALICPFLSLHGCNRLLLVAGSISINFYSMIESLDNSPWYISNLACALLSAGRSHVYVARNCCVARVAMCDSRII